MFRLSLFVGVAMVISSQSFARVLTFDEVWKKVNEKSLIQEALSLDTKAIQKAKIRVDRHWYPNIYFDLQSYQTNDPAANFFGLIQQREVKAKDFNPTDINHPDSNHYTRGALGIDVPLYEGGMKAAQSDMYDKLVLSKEIDERQIKIDQYAKIGELYATMLVLKQHMTKLVDIDDTLKKLLSKYQLGVRANPLGYSGLLGMKSLANRIKGLLQKYQSQDDASYGTLNELGLNEMGWTVRSEDPEKFIDTYLLDGSKGSPYFIESAQKNAEAAEYSVVMEKARNLPRIGFFAESYVFAGDRKSANGYSAGVYMKWNLFNPADYGKSTETHMQVLAAHKKIEALKQVVAAESKALQNSLKTFRFTIKLLKESDQMLFEQTKATTTLFKTGAINALQIVEVLNRRVDMIDQQVEVELQFIQTAAKLLSKKRVENHNTLKIN